MNSIANWTRPEGDPKIIKSGRSSVGASDTLAKGLGWFSIGLGLAELLAARAITRRLGMQGSEGLVRIFGLREIASGILTLSVDKRAGLASRVAGDALDMAVLLDAFDRRNPKRGNVLIALAVVAGAAALDLTAAAAVHARHKRSVGESRRYPSRSGFPTGVEAARGAARKSGNGRMEFQRHTDQVH